MRATYSFGLTGIVAVAAVLAVVLPGGQAGRTSSFAPAAADTAPAGNLALGRKVYEGKSGGAMCVTCHGPQARGVAGVGPDLTDETWLHGDGSPEFLRSVIASGVMKPKKTAAVMPPKGGGNLNAEQVDAVAAYVASLKR